MDERFAIPNSIQEAVPKSLKLTHTRIRGMITLGQNAFWPYMHRESLKKRAKGVPCTGICKNSKQSSQLLCGNHMQTVQNPMESFKYTLSDRLQVKNTKIYFSSHELIALPINRPHKYLIKQIDLMMSSS